VLQHNANNLIFTDYQEAVSDLARHTARNISLVVALVAVVGAGIFVFIQFGTPQLLPNEIFSVIPANELPLLELTGYVRQDITCFIKTTLVGEFTDGTFADISQSMFVGGTAGVAPTTLDLVRRTTGQEFKNLHIDGKVRCDFRNPSSDGGFFGWQVIPDIRIGLFAETNDLDGSGLVLPVIQKFPTQITLRDNTEHTFIRFTIPASQIDALYSEHVSPYRTEFRTYLVGKLVFNFPTDPTVKYGIEMKFPELYNHIFYNVEKIPAGEVPIQLKDVRITIESVIQTLTDINLESGTNTLDTSSAGGRQINILGSVKTWDPSQGTPIIEIKRGGTTPTTIASGFMTLVDRINDNQDGIFQFLYVFDRNSPEGQYFIVMTLTGRTQQSMSTIYINNTPEEPKVIIKDTPEGEEEITPTATTEAQEKLRDELLLGQLVNSFKVNFADGTFEQIIKDSTGTNFVSRTGVLVPTLALTGALLDVPPKTILSVEYGLFLRPPVAGDLNILFIDSNVRFTPKVIVSSVQEGEGSVIPQRESSSTLSGNSAQNVQNIGLAHTLGKVTITANTIEAIAKNADPPVTTGQRVELDLLLTASGDVTFKRDVANVAVVQKLEVTNTFVRLDNIIFDNQFMPDVNCQKAGLLDDPLTGGCKLPDENDPTCMTALRTDIKCDLNFINDNCPENDLTMCNEPDKDNDGVPDILDDCASTFGLAVNNGCPQGVLGEGEPCPTSGTSCVPPSSFPPIFGGLLCSATTPTMCTDGELDITTLLIIGGIGLIILGVVVFVIRRRSTL